MSTWAETEAAIKLTRSRTRPRGFIKWAPRGERQGLVDKVAKIIEDYLDILPLTLRQVFYIRVSHHGFDKTERAYRNQLVETVNLARRARLVPMDAIRDDGFTQTQRAGWTSLEEFFESFWRQANWFTLDRQQGQPRRIMLWSEAAGMVPQLEKVADEFSVQVCSSGGFDSVTAKHTRGRALADEGPLEVLHLGDHDPSGAHMFLSLEEDIEAFAGHYGGEVTFARLAVTPEQIETYKLPTAPPKETDTRSFVGSTTQCEALDPRVLAGIVKAAIEARLDMRIYQRILVREKKHRSQATRRLMLVGIGNGP